MARPRKPTEQKCRQGTYRKDRANENEPKPKLCVPVCPKGASKDYREAWAIHAAPLAEMKILTTVDAVAFKRLVDAYIAREMAHGELMRRENLVDTATSKNGSEWRSPAPEVGTFVKLDKLYQEIAGRFGMTPSDRSKVSVIEPKVEKSSFTGIRAVS